MNKLKTDRVDQTEQLANLYQLLNRESVLLEKLLHTLKLKQKAIISGLVEELKICTSNEQNIVREINELNEKKQAVLKNAGQTLSPNRSIATISNLIQYLHSSLRPHWQNMKDELRSQIDEISKLNLQNKELILTARQFMRDFVNLLLPTDDQANELYNKEGEIKDNKSKKVLNFQV